MDDKFINGSQRTILSSAPSPRYKRKTSQIKENRTPHDKKHCKLSGDSSHPEVQESKPEQEISYSCSTFPVSPDFNGLSPETTDVQNTESSDVMPHLPTDLGYR